jgi:hypothetical protein
MHQYACRYATVKLLAYEKTKLMSLKYVAMQQDETCKAAICAKTRLLHLQNQENAQM